MKTTPLRVLCLATLAAGSLAASGSLFARDSDFRGDGREIRYERHDNHSRFDRFDRRYGPRHEVIVTRYEHRPHFVERQVIVERPVYYAPAPVAYSPSIGQVVGGLIGGVIDNSNNNNNNDYNR